MNLTLLSNRSPSIFTAREKRRKLSEPPLCLGEAEAVLPEVLEAAAEVLELPVRVVQMTTTTMMTMMTMMLRLVGVGVVRGAEAPHRREVPEAAAAVRPPRGNASQVRSTCGQHLTVQMLAAVAAAPVPGRHANVEIQLRSARRALVQQTPAASFIAARSLVARVASSS